ncbi:MAG: hypothetical protein H0W36_04630 [Gemmatimonadetes bacterium]|jgi:type II secretory pathway component PulM|nr:hypothetical protein [Thermoleophilaceae bacterium]MBA3583806.1 hypothetical protein [Gemmatimonadota bacterium]
MTTVLAIPTGPAILSFIGLALGVVVLVLVVLLFNRVVGPALEIRRYAKDILTAGLAIARNVDGVDELERTRELSAKVPQLGAAYGERLGRGSA